MSLQTRFDSLEEDITKRREEFKDWILKPDSVWPSEEDYLYDTLPITFDTFQESTQWTAQYPLEVMPPEVYCAIGLAEEVGEVLSHVKKMHRDNDGVLSDERKEKVTKELGDALYYLSALALNLDIKMSDVAKINQKKLLGRLKSGKIKGSGDDR